MRLGFLFVGLAAALLAPATSVVAADAPGRYERRVYERESHARPRAERPAIVEEEPDEYVIVRRRWIEGLSNRQQERVFTREDRDDAWANSYEWDSHRIPDRDW